MAVGFGVEVPAADADELETVVTSVAVSREGPGFGVREPELV